MIQRRLQRSSLKSIVDLTEGFYGQQPVGLADLLDVNIVF
ncbi:MAG: hypothetical protein S4CHLAM45_05860 [Chlamydiales bacterium]|nr:hypothetical protein [Chlamydiales bacterium]MCH9619873.1 hypothetical protein [Chlamydiales bacterium]MCH9622700.1 hypothetical protein [Chlamydiales bacterium]